MPSRSTSISPRPVSSSSLANSRIRSCSLTPPPDLMWKPKCSALRFSTDQRRKPANSECVAFGAETADDRLRALRDVGVMAVFLALVDVGDVHLDRRNLHREDRIEDRNRRRRVAGRIDHDPGGLFRPCLVKPVDDLALAVGLAEFDLKAEALRGLAAQLFHVGERRMPVFLRLAGSKRVQVRAVEDVDRLGHDYCLRAAWIFWLSAARPTAPMTTSLPIT